MQSLLIDIDIFEFDFFEFGKALRDAMRPSGFSFRDPLDFQDRVPYIGGVDEKKFSSYTCGSGSARGFL